MARLRSFPIDLEGANEFVRRHHRHHQPVVGHKFSIAAARGEKIVGVVIVGRPVSRHRDDGLTLEVTRLCTDGARNACSFLYGAAARASFALGYARLGTYIRADEPGTSLLAAGWRMVAEVSGRSWDTPSRPRKDKTDLSPRLLFEAPSLTPEPNHDDRNTAD
ncbi:XF1762 family protein [Kaistia sp. MMO-174]|uniref:XF1762 family protein n=1 Tax=Kaistia sp. MMO-174 TaxID=3081256 RepID=UPI00301A989A